MRSALSQAEDAASDAVGGLAGVARRLDASASSLNFN
jgi:hypothetical protein